MPLQSHGRGAGISSWAPLLPSPNTLPHFFSLMHAESLQKHLLQISETETTRNLLQGELKSRKEHSHPAESMEGDLGHLPTKCRVMLWTVPLSHVVTDHSMPAGACDACLGSIDSEAFSSLDKAFPDWTPWLHGCTALAPLSFPPNWCSCIESTRDQQATKCCAMTQTSVLFHSSCLTRAVLWEGLWAQPRASTTWRPQQGANYSSRPTISALRQPYLVHQIYVISVGCLLSQLDKSAAARKVIHLVFNEPRSSSASSWQA